MRKLCCTFVVALSATLALSSLSHAEEDSPTESAQQLMAPAPGEPSGKRWEIMADGMWLPDSHSPDAAGDVGMTEAKLKVGRTFRVDSNLSFTPELSYSILNVSSPATARLPEHLHAVSAGLRSDYRANPRLFFTFLLAPGLASDFQGIGSEDLRVRFGTTVRYSMSKRLTLLGGLVYQQGYNSTRVIPIVGAIYRPTDQWTISLAAPRPGVAYAVSKDLRLNLSAEMAGGEYQLHERRLGAEVIRYRDFRLGGGADFAIVDGLKGEVAAGYAFSRRFSFYEVSDPTRRNIDVDSGPFARAALKMEW